MRGMEFIPSLVGLVFAAYVLWLVVRIVNRWPGSKSVPTESPRPGLLWGVCVLPVLAVGFILGHNGPVILVIISTGQLQRTVWIAAICLPLAAIGTERACSGLLRWWLRPLVWGMAIGAVSLLVYLAGIGWRVDLTV
jgi:hypothetical protein